MRTGGSARDPQKMLFAGGGDKGGGGVGTGVALPSAKHSRRSCDTRFSRTVTAAGDMSTFMALHPPGA